MNDLSLHNVHKNLIINATGNKITVSYNNCCTLDSKAYHYYVAILKSVQLYIYIPNNYYYSINNYLPLYFELS